jgi:hypothetical protein
MMEQHASNSQEKYYAALGRLFGDITRDPVFQTNSALHNAAIAAQSALGVVEQRLVLSETATPAEQKIVSQELQNAETALDAAVVKMLQQVVGNIGSDASAAALELLETMPGAGPALLFHGRRYFDLGLPHASRVSKRGYH